MSVDWMRSFPRRSAGRAAASRRPRRPAARRTVIQSPEPLEERRLLTCLPWITFGEASVADGTVLLGVAGRGEFDSQPQNFHGAAAVLPPASSYTIEFDYSLFTWDSYNPLTENGANGFWDSFSLSVTDRPFPQIGTADPLRFDGLGMLWGGVTYGDGNLLSRTGTMTLTFPGDPLRERYLNVVLDTSSEPQADSGLPSWGSVRVRPQIDDVSATSLALQPDGSYIFTYDVCGQHLPDTTIDFFWASGPTAAQALGGPVHRHELAATTKAPGSHSGVIDAAQVAAWGPAPDAATHLLMVVDPADVVEEFSETNNVASAPLVDFAIGSFSWGAVDGVRGTYSLIGTLDRPAAIGFYWSSDDTWDPADVVATSVALPTETSTGGSHTFALDGRHFFAPDRDHRHLLVYLDVPGPGGAVREGDETNNVAALRLEGVVDVSAQVSAPATSLLRGEVFAVEATVTNHSPVPITVEVTHGFITSFGLETPEPTRATEVVVGPGLSVPWQLTYQEQLPLDWEWIPEQNPFKTADSNGFDGLGVFLDVVGALWKPGQVIGTGYSVLNHLLVTLPSIDAVYRTQNRGGEVEFVLLVEPLIHGGERFEETITAQVDIPADKLSAFDRFVSQWKDFENKLFAATLVIDVLDIVAGGGTPSPPTNTVAMAVKNVATSVGFLDALWKQAYDPPDPSFDTFVVPRISFSDLVADVPAGPRRWREMTGELVAALEAAVAATIDKKDGAVLAADAFWQSEQLVAAGNLVHRTTFELGRGAALEAALLPYRDALLPSPQLTSDRLREAGLAAEVADVLRNAGWSDGSIAAIDQRLRQITVEELDGFDARGPLGAAYLDGMAASAHALDLLAQAIAVRVEKLGHVPRELTGAERSVLDGYRDQLEAVVQGGVPAAGVLDLAERYAAEARRLALAANDATIVAEHVDAAYRFLINPPLRFANLATWQQLVDAAVETGALSAALGADYRTAAAAVERQIAAEDWAGAVSGLRELGDRVMDPPHPQLVTAASVRLHAFLGYLQELLAPPAAADALRLEGLPATLVARPGVAVHVATGGRAVEPRVGSLAGGRLEVELAGAAADDRLTIRPTPLVEISDERRIHVAGIPIALVAGGSGGTPLRLEFLASASDHDVTMLLEQLVVELDAASPVGGRTVVLRLADGTGEVATDTAVELVAGPTGSLTVGGPAGVLRDDTLRFGTDTGGLDTATLTFTNAGTGPVTITEMGLAAGVVTLETPPLPVTLEPGSTVSVRVQASDSVQSAFDSLSVRSDDPLAAEFTVGLVQQPNSPPTLAPIDRQQVAAHVARLIVPLTAFDADEPAAHLHYTVDEPESGTAVIEAGRFLVWTPDPRRLGAYAVELTVRVRDNGPVPESDTSTFSVDVERPSRAAGTVSSADPEHVFRVPGVAGRRILLDTRGAAAHVSLIDPAGIAVAGLDAGAASTVTLDRDGEWLVVVRHAGGDRAGEYAFDLLLVDELPLLERGLVLEGGTSREGRPAAFRVSAGADEWLRFTASDVSARAGVWELFGPNGRPLAEAPLWEGFLVAAPEAGDAVLVVGRHAPAGTRHSFVVTSLAAEPQAVALGQVVGGRLTEAAPRAAFRFEVSAGQAILYDAWAATASDLRAAVFDPEGALVWSREGRTDTTFTPADSGSFTLVLEAAPSAVEATFEFRLVTAGTAAALPPDAVFIGDFHPAAAVTGVLAAPSRTHVYSLYGTAGRQLLLNASSSDGAVRLTLDGPGGARIAASGTGGSLLTELPASGLYLVTVGTEAPGDVAYELRGLYPSGRTPIAPDQRVAGMLPSGDVQSFEFTADLGQWLHVDHLVDFLPSDDPFAGATWWLTDANGEEYARGHLGIDGWMLAPSTGRYALHIVSHFPQPIPYDFVLRTTPVDSTVTLSLGGSIRDTVDPGRLHEFTLSGPAGAVVVVEPLWNTAAAPVESPSLSLPAGGILLLGPDGTPVDGFRGDAGPMSLGADETPGEVYGLWPNLGHALRLPAAGTYRLLVPGVQAEPFAYRVHVVDVASLPEVDLEAGPETLALTADSPTGILRFPQAAGSVLTISGPGAEDVVWLVVDATRQGVAAGTLADRATVLFAQPGDFLLLVSRRHAADDTDIVVRSAAVTRRPLPLDESVAGDVPPAAVHEFSFTGTAGQAFQFTAAADLPESYLLDPDGSLTRLDAFARGGPIRLVASGTHRLLIVNSGEEDAAYRFELRSLDTRPAIPAAQEMAGSAHPDQPPVAYRIELTAGEVVRFENLGNDSQTGFWTLYGPPTPNAPPNIPATLWGVGSDTTFVAAQTGSHFLFLDVTSSAAEVDYAFRWTRDETPPLAVAVGAETTGRLAAQEIVSFEFGGTAGNRLFFDARTAVDGIRVFLVAPVQGVIREWSAGEDLGLIRLPDTGRYTLLLKNLDSEARDYAFSLIDIEAAPALTPGAGSLRGSVPSSLATAWFLLGGGVGEPLIVKDVGSTPNAGMLAIFAPDGQRTNVTPLGLGFEIMLPEAGTYAVQVTAFGDEPVTFAYEISGLATVAGLPGFSLSAALATVRPGETTVIDVVLTAQPSEQVVLEFESEPAGRVTVGPDALVFTRADWNVPQRVTIQAAAAQPGNADPVVQVRLAPRPEDSDPRFAQLPAQEVAVTVQVDTSADLIWEHEDGTVVAWLGGDPTRILGPFAAAGGWRLAATGDFSGDGIRDLVWEGPDGQHVLWGMAPGGDAEFQGVLGGGDGWAVEATGDYDGDGTTDLVWRHGGSGNTVMWLMRDNAPTSQFVVGGDLDWRLVPTEERFDADGDGWADLVWRHALTGVNVLWRMQGGEPISATVLGGDDRWRIAGAGDFDGDGRGDVLWRDADTGSVIMQLLDDGVVRTQALVGGDASTTVAVTMDGDGDGKADIFWRNLGTGEIERWLMNGTTVRSKTVIGGDAVWRLLGRPGRRLA